jgi:hypothetical protein
MPDSSAERHGRVDALFGFDFMVSKLAGTAAYDVVHGAANPAG